MKKKITESQLRSIIAESVKKVLKEAYNPQDDIDAKEFMSWAMNSRSDVMQNIYGYYQASREGNESNANWYMDRILFEYADEKGCEESQLNTNAIEKAINEWGYYNYQEDDLLNENVNKQKQIINAAVDALMSVKDIVDKASNCWEYDEINSPLFQQICSAASAIHGVWGFSKYSKWERTQNEKAGRED